MSLDTYPYLPEEDSKQHSILNFGGAENEVDNKPFVVGHNNQVNIGMDPS